MKITKEAFCITGLHPFNTDVFSDVDLLPSEVSNQPQGTRIRNQPAKLIRNSKFLCPLRRTQQTAIHMPIAPRINLYLRVVKRR